MWGCPTALPSSPSSFPGPPDSKPHPCCISVLSRREFARWKVRNTAIERRDLLHNPLPLMPEFQRSIRLLGRRPTTQQFIDTIIKKYGTHILISATLGGRWQSGPWGVVVGGEGTGQHRQLLAVLCGGCLVAQSQAAAPSTKARLIVRGCENLQSANSLCK